MRARGLVAVEAGHPKRAAHLIGRVSAVLRGRATAYGRLRTAPRARAELNTQVVDGLQGEKGMKQLQAAFADVMR